MARINLNDVAKKVCELEGGKVNLPIAQVKETIKCFIDVLTGSNLYNIVEMLRKHGKINGLDTRCERTKFENFLYENDIE